MRLLRLPPIRSSILAVAIAFAAPAAALAATPIKSQEIPNFFQVNDRVYRGGQPTEAGWAALAKLGVNTVIDLRRVEEHSTEAESRSVVAAGMNYFNIPMNGWETPTSAQLDEAMKLIDNGGKVFVHCKQGRDRTGTVVAFYRMKHEGWENARALDEALACGIHWYSQGMKRLIREYGSNAASGSALASTRQGGGVSTSAGAAGTMAPITPEASAK